MPEIIVTAPFSLNLDDGRQYTFQIGRHDVPDEVADHEWTQHFAHPAEVVETAKPAAADNADDASPVAPGCSDEKDEICSQLDAAGVKYDRRLGIAKLRALIPAA